MAKTGFVRLYTNKHAFETIPELVNLFHLRVQKLYAATAVIFTRLRLAVFQYSLYISHPWAIWYM